MWTDKYWSRYWADRYWPAVGQDSNAPTSTDVDKNYVLGLGMMGKSRAHPHPIFSRHKQ